MTSKISTPAQDISTSNISRRNLLLGLGVTAAVAYSGSALSEVKSHQHPVLKNASIIDAMEGCISAGKVCLNHCLELLGVGDTSMDDCSKNVYQMLPVCEAMRVLALAKSKNLKVLAKACLDCCTDCAKACSEHKDDHPECMACYKACKHSIEVVEAYLQTA